MPFKGRTYGTGMPYKRLAYRKPAGTYASHNATKSYVKSQISRSVELKSHDLEATFSPTPSGTVTPFCSIVQGDGVGFRDGNEICVKSIVLRDEINQNALAGANTVVRRIVFVDKQQVSDSTPGPDDVLNFAGSNDWLAQYSLTKRGRFKILSDQFFNFSLTGGTNIRTQSKTYWFKNGIMVRYNGATTTDIQKNGIYILYISNDGSNPPAVAFQSRTNFRG